MTTKVAVLTAIYDDYDVLRPVLPQMGDLDIEWICVTDTQSVVTEPQGWSVVYEPRPGVHPNLAAKKPKMLPWEYTSAPTTIWVDASFQIASDRFVQEVIGYANPMAQFVHPDRNCLYAEASLSQSMTYKYGGHRFNQQVSQYRDEGHPPDWGLWATGVIVRHRSMRLVEFGKAWQEECYRHSFQDQVSQPAVLRRFGLRPDSLPGSPYRNAWLDFRGSGRH